MLRYINIKSVFGALLAAASLVSLIQKVTSVGIYPVFADIIDYYRWFIYEVLGYYIFELIFRIRFPEFVLEKIALWFIFASSYMATIRKTIKMQLIEDISRDVRHLLFTGYLFLGVFGLVIALFALNNRISDREQSANYLVQRAMRNEFDQNIFTILIVIAPITAICGLCYLVLNIRALRPLAMFSSQQRHPFFLL